MKYLIVFLIIFLTIDVCAEEECDCVLSGFVYDYEDYQNNLLSPLVGTVIRILESDSIGAVSNDDGFFQIKHLSKKSYLLKVTRLDCFTLLQEVEIGIEKDTIMILLMNKVNKAEKEYELEHNLIKTIEPSSAVDSSDFGRISGFVRLSDNNNTPAYQAGGFIGNVSGALIICKSDSEMLFTKTSAIGTYELVLPQGKYNIQVSYSSKFDLLKCSRYKIKDVKVKKGKTIHKNFTLLCESCK
ncbi:MAG: carboxypeptidase regulatory-like domain-containing protein [Calditrichaeota bacterium]|nr:MAG: carboxypeptidase regulatory-like domain-containing protein [Calditrichota bacterium]